MANLCFPWHWTLDVLNAVEPNEAWMGGIRPARRAIYRQVSPCGHANATLEVQD